MGEAAAMILAAPHQLWWLLLLALGLGAEYIYSRLKARQREKLFGPELAPIMLRFWDDKRVRLKVILIFLAGFFIILALARPQWGKKEENLSLPGIDVVVAFDVSKSMLANDLPPNRLENAKDALGMLTSELAGNRLALVAFAGSSFIECPLTSDLGAIKVFLSAIKPDLIPVPGTDIGGAIRTSVQAFGETTSSKAIILITDGEDLFGQARAAAADAAGKGIRIYPIGIGSTTGAPVPEVDENNNVIGNKRDKNGGLVVSRLDKELLAEIAQRTAGQVFLVESGGATVSGLMGALSALPKKGQKNTLSYEHQDRFQWFVLIALLLLTAEFILVERKR